MDIKAIESPQNSTFRRFLGIKDGEEKKDGVCLVEGRDLVDEALRAGKLTATISTDPSLLVPSLPGYSVTEKLYKRLSVFTTPSDIIGIVKLDISTKIGKRNLYLDGVQDPGNVGTLIRTALCFGFDSVLLSPGCASLTNHKTIQASKGAIFHVSAGYMEYDELVAANTHLYLTCLEGRDELEIHDPEEPFTLVLGSEGKGIPQEHMRTGERIRIAMSSDFDSLNVAVAGGIFMYRFRRR